MARGMGKAPRGGKSGNLNKDPGKHSVPGFMSGGGHPKEVDARHYTDENKVGPSPHGTKINLPS